MKSIEIEEKLKALESVSRQLDPDLSTRNQWHEAVRHYGHDFLDNIYTSKAYNISEDNGIGLLDTPISETGYDIDTLLQTLKENVDTPGLNPASGGHLGYIPGGGIYPTALGDYLADVSNRYAGIFYGGPGAVRMENMLLRWMCGIIGYPKEALGNLTSGGSIANLIAITTARDFKKIKARDIEHCVIYLTEQVHHCVQKAIRIAGLNEAKLTYVPVDENYKMDMTALREAVDNDIKNGLKPFLVVGSAGTTDVGAVDPLDEIADIAEANDIWFHVDAAYGGFFILVDEMKANFKGMERSDSLAIDPHKGLFLSYGSGAVLIKNVQAQFDTHYYRANYMQDTLDFTEELNPADLSPELTKHFRGLRMWLPLQLYGLDVFRKALEEKIYLTRYFYEKIQNLGFEVGPYPELSVMIYRFVPKDGDANAFNQAILEAVKKDGRVFISSTLLNGIYWLRLAVLSFRTHQDTIDILLEVIESEVYHRRDKFPKMKKR